MPPPLICVVSKSKQCYHHPGKERLLSGAHSGVAGIKKVIFIDMFVTYLRLFSPSVFCILGLTYSSISNLSLFSFLTSSCLCLSLVYLQHLSVSFLLILLILPYLAISWLGLVMDRFWPIILAAMSSSSPPQPQNWLENPFTSLTSGLIKSSFVVFGLTQNGTLKWPKPHQQFFDMAADSQTCPQQQTCVVAYQGNCRGCGHLLAVGQHHGI